MFSGMRQLVRNIACTGISRNSKAECIFDLRKAEQPAGELRAAHICYQRAYWVLIGRGTWVRFLL